MSFIKRLMEIKEEQLELEWCRRAQLGMIETHLINILKELKGGKKKWKK